MTRFLTHRGAAALGLALLLVGLVGGLVWREAVRLERAAAKSSEARELLARLDGLTLRLAEAAACRCSFLIRAEAAQRERFRHSAAAIRGDLQQLRDSTRNGDRSDRLQEAAELAGRKLALLEESITLRERQRFSDRRQLALTGQVEEAGDALRNALAALRYDVDRELAEQSARSRSSARAAGVAAGVGNVLAVVLLGLTGLAFCRDLVAQKRSADAARLSQQQAEGLAAEQAARLIQTQTALDELGRLQAKLEEHFRQAQRLASVGRVTSEVIHDFNNLLTVILACSESTLRGLSADHPSRDVLAQAVQAGHRAADLTRQVLAVGRARPGAPGPCDLNASTAEMGPILRRVAGSNTKFRLALAEGLPPVIADRGQLGQILLNLTANARDAMPEGGSLTVETRPAEGGRAELAVTDTGCGMDSETVARMFEPFFTTKGEGKGTGLGMAIVQDAVARCGGSVEADSEPGKGTCVRIYFRLAGAPPDGPPA